MTLLSLMLVILLVGKGTETCRVSQGDFMEAESVKAEIGHDVILPCVAKFKINVNDDILEWKKDQHDIFHVRDGSADWLHFSYNNRKTPVVTEELQKNNASLKLTAVNETDGGEYCCCIITITEEEKCTNVTLEITTNNSTQDKQIANPKSSKKTSHPEAVSSNHMPVIIVVILVSTGLVVAGCYVLWRRRKEFAGRPM